MKPLDPLLSMPGHAIRRLQQRAVARFMAAVKPLGLTPVQYAALHQLALTPRTDQRSLAYAIELDTSTVADVLDRLQSRGLVQRLDSDYDRRVKLVALTPEGEAVLDQAAPLVREVQSQLLAGLSDSEQVVFQSLLHKLLT